MEYHTGDDEPRGYARGIADAVRLLASPGARQITGQVVAVNGGEWPAC